MSSNLSPQILLVDNNYILKDMKKSVLYSIVLFSLCFVKLTAQSELYDKSFSLTDVELLDGIFKHAQDLNSEVLLEYNIDRLLAPFLKEAGLEPKAESFENWIDLDGHIGGHYLSALAIHYASTGNLEIKSRIDYFVSELKRCQDAHGNGYVGGIPNGDELWTRIKNRDWGVVWSYWVPWYNIHKTFAGLRDAWYYADNELAKVMFLELCDWGIDIISNLNDNEMEGMLGNEFGGMNEVYADAYKINGEQKYLQTAKRFSHKFLFDSMLNGIDNLDNIHANTQVPKAVGYQRVSEVSNDNDYFKAASFFWSTVVNNRSLSFGGNSRREHFPSKDDCISYTEEREGPETCNTNNMLKLSAGLYRQTGDVKYMDFYERAMFNHILSSQHPGHGGYVYFTSARPRHYRVYSAPNQAMWCCVGTGMENHGKYAEMIYAHNNDELFINLFVASILNWKEKGIRITQNTQFPFEDEIVITINVDNPTQAKLMIRHPWWVQNNEMEVVFNGTNYGNNSNPSNYIEINETWNDGDVITIKTPMRHTISRLPNVPNYISVLYGPILLAVKTGEESLDGLIADDGRWSHIAHGRLLPLVESPFSIATIEEIEMRLNQMQTVEGEKLKFKAENIFEKEKDKELIFEPFFSIHDSRYLMYWLSLSQDEYEKYISELDEKEKEFLLLEERTVDMVSPAEQQPEVDHLMKTKNSRSGYHYEEGWRDAIDDGWFSYNLLTENRTDLSLMVRYWGNEGGNRKFNILIDDELLITENIVNKWNVSEFVNVEYDIPESMLEGKESITVKFECLPYNIAGGVFKVRLLKKLPTSNVFYDLETNPQIYVESNKIIFKNLKKNDIIKIYSVSGVLLNSIYTIGPEYIYSTKEGIYVVNIEDKISKKVLVPY